MLAPWLQGMVGVAPPITPSNAFANIVNTPPTAPTITVLILQVVSAVIMFSGFRKIHLVQTSAYNLKAHA